jgi:hypothetical protein
MVELIRETSMAISDSTLPLVDPDNMMIPQYERETEPTADALRKAIARPGTLPLLAIIVRSAISLELPSAFPAMDYRDTELNEMIERLQLEA